MLRSCAVLYLPSSNPRRRYRRRRRRPRRPIWVPAFSVTCWDGRRLDAGSSRNFRECARHYRTREVAISCAEMRYTDDRLPSSQVLENVRNQSCEGLALPFLFNWLLGAWSLRAHCLSSF